MTAIEVVHSMLIVCHKKGFAMQELCGKGSSRSDFLQCMVKTRQWQDAQVANKTDGKPWKAYYRVLGHLDLQRAASGEDPGFQNKFCEWLEECLSYPALYVHCGDVWTILSDVRRQLLDEHSLESGLKTWQHSFLEDTLQNQWENTQPSIGDATAGLPVNFAGVDSHAAPPLADAARQPRPTEQLGSDDFDMLGSLLASPDARLPSSPVGFQQHAEQMLAFDNQPNAEVDPALHGRAQGHLEVGQAKGNCFWVLHGTSDNVFALYPMMNTNVPPGKVSFARTSCSEACLQLVPANAIKASFADQTQTL